MKKLMSLLILSVVSAFALDHTSDKNEFYLGGFDGEISTQQCVEIGKNLALKLEGLEGAENLSVDTFSVKTVSSFTRNNHHRLVYLCRAFFGSKDPRYSFVVNNGVFHYGSDRNIQCQHEQDLLQEDAEVLAVKSFFDYGWAFNLSCYVTSVSLKKSY